MAFPPWPHMSDPEAPSIFYTVDVTNPKVPTPVTVAGMSPK